ncbi:response regulator [Patulibacter minatonensis]|uniref:response regulator n=1 Tax=Patulibacter minatonensis TaxID=298163 RepID=UPI0012FC801A|nr:response regulator [Patulibacter minatonensis]
MNLMRREVTGTSPVVVTVAQPMDPTPGAPTPAREIFALRRVSVVLAADNDRFRAGMVRALRRRADTELLCEVPAGRAALAAAREFRPDVLVVDDRLPGLSGPEVARAVATDPDLRRVRILILSAGNRDAERDRARLAGALDLVDKSRTRDELCDTIVAAARTPPRSWHLLA